MTSILTLASLVFIATTGVEGDATPKLTGVLIPYYADVNSKYAWGNMTAAIQKANVDSSIPWVIINANSGPPTSDSSSWKTLASNLRAIAKVVVYVDTCSKQPVKDCSGGENGVQGMASVSTVTGLLNKWISAIGLSNIDGVFLDDTPVRTTSNNVVAIASAVRGIVGSGRKIFANQGESSKPDSSVMQNIDVAVLREDTSVGSSSVCSKGYASSRLAMILHGASLSTSNVNNAKGLCYGWYYATAGVWESTVANTVSDVTKIIKCVANNGC